MNGYKTIWLLFVAGIVINFNLFIEPYWGFVVSILILGLINFSVAWACFGLLKLLKLDKERGSASIALLLFAFNLYGNGILWWPKLLAGANVKLLQSQQFINQTLWWYKLGFVIITVSLVVVLYLFNSNTKFKQFFVTFCLLVLLIVGANRTYSYYQTAFNFTPIEAIETNPNKTRHKLEKGISKPDIYYVLMDGYTGNTALKEFWEFDNSEFKDTLANLGFEIADSARGRIPATIGAMSIIFNASDFNNPQLCSQNMDWVVKKHIRQNALFNVLKANGYAITANSMFWDETPFFFGQGETDPKLTEFAPLLTRNFVFRLLVKVLNLYFKRFYTNYHWFYDYDARLEKELQLQTHGGELRKQPSFVFNHLLYTHNDYRYDSLGNKVDLALLSTQKLDYINQVKHNNNVCLSYFNNLIQLYKSKNRELVIIAFSDHGSRETYTAEEDSQIQLMVYDSQKRLRIIDQQQGMVNTTRSLLNTYFGYQIPQQAYKYHNIYPH